MAMPGSCEDVDAIATAVGLPSSAYPVNTYPAVSCQQAPCGRWPGQDALGGGAEVLDGCSAQQQGHLAVGSIDRADA